MADTKTFEQLQTELNECFIDILQLDLMTSDESPKNKRAKGNKISVGLQNLAAKYGQTARISLEFTNRITRRAILGKMISINNAMKALLEQVSVQ
jgi:hypothetical protein